MSGRWDPTPDQYDGPVVRPPTRIVVAGEAVTVEEFGRWPAPPYDETNGHAILLTTRPKPSRLRRIIDTIRMSW